MEGVSVMLLTPAYGGQVFVPYYLSVVRFDRLCRDNNIPFNIESCYNESLIQRARNSNVDGFLRKTDYTHALFIDSDIEFNENDIINLIKSNKDIIGGLYPKKKINWDNISNKINNDKEKYHTPSDLEAYSKEYVLIHRNNTMNFDENGIVETRYVGTGYMLVKRSVFLDMMEEHPFDFYNANGNISFMFFNSELRYGAYLSEDYWFCDRWLCMNKQIFMMNVKANHYGTNKF